MDKYDGDYMYVPKDRVGLGSDPGVVIRDIEMCRDKEKNIEGKPQLLEELCSKIDKLEKKVKRLQHKNSMVGVMCKDTLVIKRIYIKDKKTNKG